MRKYLFGRGMAPAAVVTAVLAVLIPGQASAAVAQAATACPTPPVSQPFLQWGDSNWYTPAPGVVPDSFSGAGWVLAGGAKVISSTLADGTTGLVLDLPPGASATSPTMCIDSSEPYARMIERTVGSDALSNAVTFYVTPAGSTRMSGGSPVLSTTQWSESAPVSVFRGDGPEEAYFTFVSQANTGDLQVYDLYIDPRMLY